MFNYKTKMIMKKFNFILLFFMFLVVCVYGQTQKEYVVLKNHDTCFCDNFFAGTGKIKCEVKGEQKKFKYKEVLFYLDRSMLFIVSDDGAYQTKLRIKNEKYMMSEDSYLSPNAGSITKYHFYDLDHKLLDKISLKDKDLYQYIQKYFGSCDSFKQDIIDFKNAAAKVNMPINEMSTLLEKYYQKCSK